jgi:PAS domain S-box-containing protein
MNKTPTPGSPVVPALESVLCTEELNRRPSRPPDYESENSALISLAQALADSPRTILQTLADTILKLFQCGSAGISLLTEDGTRFYWPAIAGLWNPQLGGGTPREFGPCGDVLDLNCPLLFRHPERRYTYFQPLMPPAEECLLVPFYVEGKAVGTIWAISHDDRPGARKFDSEDRRALMRLGTFASAAYQAVEQLDALRNQADERHNAQQAMREMNEALLLSSVRQHELADQAQEAERKMHESEVRYRSLFESAKDGILILDAHTGKITDANACMCDLMETESHELLGKELWEIGLFTDKAAGEAAVRELQEQGFVRYEHSHLESTRGRRVEVEVVANVYRADNHQVVQCNFRDISERSRLERRMGEQAAALVELDHRKDEFLAMLSHELRNPLAPILNAVQLLQLQEGETSVQRKAHAIIERQVGQLTHLVDDLMEVSRALTGRIQLRHEQIAVSGIVECAVETVRSLIDQRNHELTVSVPSEPIWLYADAARLEQVVTNLLTNAVKYTGDGGHIWLSAQQEGDKAVLRVRDTGLGITPVFLPHVFDLFAQAERSSDRSQGGLGIGLALVKRLVEMHEGTVSVSSTLGQGSEFAVSLPVDLSMAHSQETQSPPTEIAKSTNAGLRVLVVDDNVDAATVLELLLQNSGHRVRVAHTGPTGLAAALDYRPDVMLVDIGLPELDGWEVAKRIRQQSALHNIVLVAMTGYGREPERQRSQEAGFDHHLVKPADFKKVLQILATVAEKAR